MLLTPLASFFPYNRLLQENPLERGRLPRGGEKIFMWGVRGLAGWGGGGGRGGEKVFPRKISQTHFHVSHLCS